MRKDLVAAALVVIVLGFVLAFYLQETRIDETIIDEWEPINPPTLYPHWNYEKNEFNITGYAFMSRAEGDPKKRAVLESTFELFLELNISSSNVVRVRVGSISPVDSSLLDEYYSLQAAPRYAMTAIFDEHGIHFRHKVRVDGTDASFLDIINDGATPVSISGSVKLVGKIRKTSYPLLGPSVLACLAGFLLLLYGFFSKSKRKFRRRRIRK